MCNQIDQATLARFSKSAKIDSKSSCALGSHCDSDAPQAPSQYVGSCDYYLWRYANFLERHSCCNHTPPDYYLCYGFKYCTYFAQLTQYFEALFKTTSLDEWSYGVMGYRNPVKWIAETRRKLQELLEAKIQENPKIEIQGAKFQTIAFLTHAQAYEESGFSSLHPGDMAVIVSRPWIENFYDQRTYKQALELAQRSVDSWWSGRKAFREKVWQLQEVQDIFKNFFKGGQL